MKVFTVAIQKGGTGKTTLSAQLAAGLHAKGYRTLAVDMDAQGNLTSLYTLEGWNPDNSLRSVYGVLKGDCNVHDAIYETQYGFDIMAGSIDMAAADMEFTKTGREYMLRRVLESVENEYDVVVIDTPPSLGIATINALTASDTVIIPVCPDAFALTGLKQLHDSIGTVKEYCNSKLKVGGILITRVDHTNITEAVKNIVQDAAATLETKTYTQTIRQAVAVRESQFFQKNLLDQDTAVSDDYRKFIDGLEGEELK